MTLGDSDNDHLSFQQTSGDNGGTFDPYFVENSDIPTSSLVTVVFNGVNFIRWSRNIKRALIAKNKEGFFNGEIQKPVVNHKDYPKWKRADFMVVSWILSSMNNDLADDFGYIDNAVELWKELNERFGQSNGPLIYQLKKEIDNLNQENITIVTYYGKLKKLWDEMQNLRAFPTCVCGYMSSCSCQFLKKVAEFEEQDKMMKFLPSINRVFSITQQIEKQKEVNTAATESGAMNSSAMAAQNHKGGQFQRFNNGQGKKDWKDLKKEKNVQISKGSEYGGGRLAAHVHSADVGDNPLDDTMTDSGAVSSEMLNTICQEVMKVMKGKHSQNGEVGGISCSYVNYADLLMNERKLQKLIKLGLPDGTQMTVNTIGDIVLSDKLTLNDVLLVHDYRHNLLSVGRLIEQTSVHVVFTSDGYSFQNPYSFKLIGRCWKEKTRLDHPSLPKMKYMNAEYCRGLTKYNSDTYLPHNKIQVAKVVSEFLAMVETQFNKKVRELDLIMNGRVERKHRSLLEIARALRFHSGLPKKFWEECVLTATHLINKPPSKVLNWKTPFEIMFHSVPVYERLMVFGSLCFAYNTKVQKDKFDSRSRRCVFIGYPAGYKAFKLYDLDTHTVFVSRDVIFFETIFPYKLSLPDKNLSPLPQTVSFGTEVSSPNTVDLIFPISPNTHISHNSPSPSLLSPSSLNTISHSIPKNIPSSPISTSSANSDQISQSLHVLDLITAPTEPFIRQSTRLIKPPTILKDFVGSYVPHRAVASPTTTESLSFSVNTSLTDIMMTVG
ncbi:uncharacterized protein [Spinacia oleracea]|uniref:Retrotransposon Copia-like N-terminal domain-containing protein n=1 Tax=Spinacia oleracea TaxID=3562 RepID=A0ABM3RJI6_SPIOL|nr:uncharacterized protein LOC110792599 [Spinacia oleracea]